MAVGQASFDDQTPPAPETPLPSCQLPLPLLKLSTLLKPSPKFDYLRELPVST